MHQFKSAVGLLFVSLHLKICQNTFYGTEHPLIFTTEEKKQQGNFDQIF